MFEQGATPQKATCSTRIQTEEEDAYMQEEDDSAKDEADKARLIKKTRKFGIKMEAIEEPLEEGGPSTPARAVKTQPNADIAESSATTKKSAERRCVSWLPLFDNSPLAPPSPSTTITVDYS